MAFVTESTFKHDIYTKNYNCDSNNDPKDTIQLTTSEMGLD